MTSFDLDALDPRYTTILCDIWGVVHDGVRLHVGAADRLQRWREEGRRVVLITNAPRTAAVVRGQLDRLGLPRDAYDGISTGGQAGIDALKQCGSVGFLGTHDDFLQMEEAGLRFHDGGFTDLCCTGLDDERDALSDYRDQLEVLAAEGVLFHCLNPDRIVMRGGVAELCAGSLADAYAALGGEVRWYGKPWPAIYAHALELVGNPAPETVLAIGDGLQTDVLGAARQGFACLFVSGGINEGSDYPSDFGERNGLGGWAPIGSVPTIA